MDQRLSLALSPARMAELESLAERATAMPQYLYPWSSLEDDLRAARHDSFPCVGYGSLVNRSSAQQTLRSEAKKLIIAFGVRRLFNLDMADFAKQRYSGPVAPEARAALNVVATGRSSDVLNGTLFDISLDDIPGFRSRENGYDLIPVACMDWALRDDPPFLAYILSCPDEPREGVVRTSLQIEPHPQYYDLCRNGAASFGEEFLQFWLATTFLADGVTSVAEWEKRR